MTARLFKDVTASGVHQTTALGNEEERKKGKKKPKAISIAEIQKTFAKAQVLKVDESLGLVFGFAIICKKDGADYVDLQDDHIPEDAMLKAATDFMLHSRTAKEMHSGDPMGSVVFAFPLTSDIAKALDIQTVQTGLLIAMKPDEGMLAKFKSGELTGFSIGGYRLVDEEA